MLNIPFTSLEWVSMQRSTVLHTHQLFLHLFGRVATIESLDIQVATHMKEQCTVSISLQVTV